MSLDRFSFLEHDLHPRILLLGDVMLDRYLFGDVERISPEAPIPVLRISGQQHRLGGAGSVASMAAALGARITLAAVVGEDSKGTLVRNLLEEARIDTRFVLTVADRCTTVKERLLGRTQQRHPHQMMRVDRESDQPIEAD
jgi:D-beta-D-heptose 7-phosphate kinase/D-beta-D-heptose 1-phosphate adenosyltransferase